MKYIKPYTGNTEYTYERERKRYFGLLGCCRTLIQGREGVKFIEDLEELISKSYIFANQKIGSTILEEMGLANDDWKKFKIRIDNKVGATIC